MFTSAADAAARDAAVFIPGIMNFDRLRNSSGVIFSGKSRVTAIPGNLVVYVAAMSALKSECTGFTNWPVNTEFGIVAALIQAWPCVTGWVR